ncbi:HNH endonuclease signature motif containing protein [Streptomyces sp. NPDC058239]|uniref:HNH endonuclease signature motif containing protein n=1 Tax=Streptomyces sp. NPDC058239 TaxID=3346395 RepID=UPI0036E77B3E
MTDRICAASGCMKTIHARGLCGPHYNRWKRSRDVQAEPLLNLSGDIEERFWARVDKTDSGCWLWVSSSRAGNYGDFHFAGVRYRAHVWAYERFVGPVPKGLQLDHLCHTNDSSCAGGVECLHRRCVNPAHLEPVTARENILRGNSIHAANAAKTHCVKGHPFDAANTHVKSRGNRVCRTCQRASMARYRARKKASTDMGDPS